MSGGVPGRADPPHSASLAVLRRFVAPAPEAEERCELCAAQIPDEHSHVVNLDTRRLLCSCRPCTLLFTQPGAGQGRFKAVPDRRRRLDSFRLSDAQWSGLEIPVRLAFLFENSKLGRPVAFYPSPAGATECTLSLEAWREIRDANPELSDLEPDVEALLVYGKRNQPFGAFTVPIDACYELTGRLRQSWKGIDGGDTAAAAIDAFLAGLGGSGT